MKTRIILIVLLGGLILRLALVPVARHGDINNNVSWGQLLLSRGPKDFYEGKEWPYSSPNQPPLYLITFALSSLLQNKTTLLIRWANTSIPLFPSHVVWWFEQWGELYYSKLPGIIADIGIGYVIYRFVGGKKGLLLGLVWLLNPVAWYNSAVWGGTDSIVNLLGLLSALFVYKKSLLKAAVLFTLAVLFKGSLLVLLPLLFLYAIKSNYSLQSYLRALGGSFITFLVVSWFFHPSIDILLWFSNLYLNRFLPGEIGSLTANAFNFWWLVDNGPTLDNTTYAFLTARQWGIVITIFFLIFLLYKAFKNKLQKKDMLVFGLSAFVSFLFMTRIHERYLYPFFPFATISLAFFPWMWLPYALLSVTHVMNLYNLFWAPGIPVVESMYRNSSLLATISVVQLCLFLYIFIRYFVSERRIRRK